MERTPGLGQATNNKVGKKKCPRRGGPPGAGCISREGKGEETSRERLDSICGRRATAGDDLIRDSFMFQGNLRLATTFFSIDGRWRRIERSPVRGILRGGRCGTACRIPRLCYSAAPMRPVLAALFAFVSASCLAAEYPVADVAGFDAAVAKLGPGDVVAIGRTVEKYCCSTDFGVRPRSRTSRARRRA